MRHIFNHINKTTKIWPSLQTMPFIPQSPSSCFPFAECGLDLLCEPGGAGQSIATVELIWLKMSFGVCLHSVVSSLPQVEMFLLAEHHLTDFLHHPLLGAVQLEEDIFKDLCIFNLCAYVCVCVCHACTSAHRGHRVFWFPGTGVQISCELSDVGGRNWTQVSWKSIPWS